MKIGELIEIIEGYAPISLGDDGDRDKLGLQVGSYHNECTGVATCLDCTEDAVQCAIDNGCNLVVSHHPFIYYPIRKIETETSYGKAIELALKHGVTIYSAHTNFDKCEVGTNAKLVQKIGGNVVSSNGCGFAVSVEKTTVRELAKRISEVIGDKTIKVAGDCDKTVETYAICSGGGGGAFDLYRWAINNADVYVSGDVPHHMYINAQESTPIIEFSHYYSEISAEDSFAEILSHTGVKIVKSNQPCPFRTLEEL